MGHLNNLRVHFRSDCNTSPVCKILCFLPRSPCAGRAPARIGLPCAAGRCVRRHWTGSWRRCNPGSAIRPRHWNSTLSAPTRSPWPCLPPHAASANCGPRGFRPAPPRVCGRSTPSPTPPPAGPPPAAAANGPARAKGTPAPAGRCRRGSMSGRNTGWRPAQAAAAGRAGSRAASRPRGRLGWRNTPPRRDTGRRAGRHA